MMFEVMEYDVDAQGRITGERVTGEEFLPADDVILAIGQENAFPWIERDLGIEFDKWDVPVVDDTTQSTRKGVFFGGDAAFGPQEHHLGGRARPPGRGLGPPALPGPRRLRPARARHEPAEPQDGHARVVLLERLQCGRAAPDAHVSLKERFKKINIEVELGFTAEQAVEEVQRCLNCDVQTVFTPSSASSATPASTSARSTA
jgi:formate dehydrogenase (NADP+) beta subunit